MSSFVPEKEHLRHALLFNQKKKAVESHRLLVETYGEHAPSIRTCETWFRQFKSGDFNVKDSERSGRPQKCEDEQLQELLDDDPTQTQRQLAEALHVSQETISRRLRAMGKINKLGKWVPHNLNERQMENRKVTCEMLLQRHERKSFLYRIVTKNEFILKTRSGKNRGFHLAKPVHQHQGQIASARRPCSVSGGIRAVLCIMNS
ncbi:hypothetical protein P5V15_015528 [Pogonomyrmex californicus]